MKTTEEVLEEMPERTYLWADGFTIDMLVDNENKSFVKELVDLECLKCGNLLISGNEHLFDGFDGTVKGLGVTCKGCGQKWFVHKPITEV